MSFLERIRPAKEAEVQALRAAHAENPPQRPDDLPVRDFPAALQGGNRIIAEIKRKSPSHPAFQQAASPATLARAYRRNGAAALSIVVDAAHFGTSLADVAGVKAAVDLPVLVKDFVIDEVQIIEAWAQGADCALLIVSMLDAAQLAHLVAFAGKLGLHVLVECHDAAEISAAVATGAAIIGVNNRDLKSLTTDLAHGEALLPLVAGKALAVSESGLYTRADVQRMADQGADAFLIGHALLQSADPGRKVAELCGRETEGMLRVKTCGLTRPTDAVLAHDAGSHILGMIFAQSRRRVDNEGARAIRDTVPEARLCGVFLNADPVVIAETAAACDLDLIQLHGEESPQQVQAVRDLTGLPVIKVLPGGEAIPTEAARYPAAAYFLVDLPKGTGAVGDPAAVQAAAADLTAAGYDVFLAGGLNPENVRAALTAVRPFGVDAARGTEVADGIKDPAKVRQFITEATR